MTNNIEQLNELIRNAKMLRRFADYASKARKHRYERRKIRSVIRLGEWNDDSN